MCNLHSHYRAWDAYVADMQELALRLPGSQPELPFGDLRPADAVPVITAEGDAARVELMKWGWSRPNGGPLLWVQAEHRRDPPWARGLTPVDAFYEYRGDKPPKSQFRFTPLGNEPLAMVQIIKDGHVAHATIGAGPDVLPVHKRQPVLVPRSSWRRVLLDPEWPGDLMQPTPAGLLRVEQTR